MGQDSEAEQAHLSVQKYRRIYASNICGLKIMDMLVSREKLPFHYYAHTNNISVSQLSSIDRFRDL